MSTCEQASSGFGTTEAERLLEQGWDQGSVFRPNERVLRPEGASDNALLVVCSQACVVVSRSLTRDPHVELAVGEPVAKHKPRSQQATGEDVRKFHLRVVGAGCEAIEININSRFRVERDALLGFEPDFQVEDAARRDFAGWLGRYYTRVALPNELVRRLDASWSGQMKNFLRAAPATPLGEGITAHEDAVQSVYIQWRPNVELSLEQTYNIDVMLLCRDAEHAEALERALIARGIDVEGRTLADGVSSSCAVKSTTETYVSELDGWTRFTHWDHLSGLGEALSASL